MRQMDLKPHIGQSFTSRLFKRSASLPLPVLRDFIDTLFDMRLPIAGLGIVYIAICIPAALHFDDPIYFMLAGLCALTTALRLFIVRRYRQAYPVNDLDSLRLWECHYAIGTYSSAVLLGLLNIVALSTHRPAWHLIAVSLVLAFGAGLVARVSVRPKICIMGLLLAVVPMIAALVFNAIQPHSDSFHMELYLMEAMLLTLTLFLSLQSVAHLYRTSIEHHTIRHDLARLAKFDALTGLPNRLLLRERFDISVSRMHQSQGSIALHFLDLDGFKAVNDQYGHPVGDALLEQVAHRIEAVLRSGDTVARLGGDEFVVLQNGLLHEDEATLLARRIIRKLSHPYYIGGVVCVISASVGIASAPRQGDDLEELLAFADGALYCAKSAGKAQASFQSEGATTNTYLAA